MKIYNPPPATFRVQILRKGDKGVNFSIQDGSIAEFLTLVKYLVEKQGISPFDKSNRTDIIAREISDGNNGKCHSISFRGLSPQQVFELIQSELK